MAKKTPQQVYEEARGTIAKILNDLKEYHDSHYHLQEDPSAPLQPIIDYCLPLAGHQVKGANVVWHTEWFRKGNTAYLVSDNFTIIFPESLDNFKGINENNILITELKKLRDHPPESLTKQPAWKYIQHTVNLLLHLITIFPMIKRCEQEGSLWAGIKSFFQAEPMQKLREIDNELKKIQKAYEKMQDAYLKDPNAEPSSTSQ